MRRLVALLATVALTAATLAATVAVGLLVAPVPALAGGGCHGADGSVHLEEAAGVVRMDVCSFAPTVTRVAAGAEVTFLNTAAVAHVVTGERGSWGSGRELQPGESFSQRFADPGTFPYTCPIHPGMVGAVIVEDGTPGAADAGDQASPATPPPGGSGGSGTLALAAAFGLAGLAAGAVTAWLAASRRRPADATTG